MRFKKGDRVIVVEYIPCGKPKSVKTDIVLEVYKNGNFSLKEGCQEYRQCAVKTGQEKFFDKPTIFEYTDFVFDRLMKEKNAK